MDITVHTDGGFSYHEKLGSWAFIAQLGSYTVERYGLVEHNKQTSQVAEMFAILNTLKFCFDELCKSSDKASKQVRLTIYSDSQYCVNTINEWMYNWERQGWMVDKQNLDLWKIVFALKRKFSSVKMIWVKGHAGIEMNERVDRLTQIPLEQYRR